jgi:hypothetical protein
MNEKEDYGIEFHPGLISSFQALIVPANRKYNNLFRSIALGGLSFSEPPAKARLELYEEKEESVPQDLIDHLEWCKKFRQDQNEETILAGLTANDAKKYIDNITSVMSSGTLTQEDLVFTKDFLGKIEKISQGMLKRGYAIEDIRQ